MIFDRLAIGTANWGKEYNGSKVSEDDQKRILDYCREVGIDMIDTATAYEWDWTKAKDFKVVVKVKTKKDIDKIKERPFCLMAHGIEIYKQSWFQENFSPLKRSGASIYNPDDIHNMYSGSIAQIPYSLCDRRFEKLLENQHEIREIHVRSIFLRGKLLEDFSPYDCIVFCLMNPYIDRVILGADSYDQFVYNLAHLDKLCNSQIDDEKILDPRKWKDEK